MIAGVDYKIQNGMVDLPKIVDRHHHHHRLLEEILEWTTSNGGERDDGWGWREG